MHPQSTTSQPYVGLSPAQVWVISQLGPKMPHAEARAIRRWLDRQTRPVRPAEVVTAFRGDIGAGAVRKALALLLDTGDLAVDADLLLTPRTGMFAKAEFRTGDNATPARYQNGGAQ